MSQGSQPDSTKTPGRNVRDTDATEAAGPSRRVRKLRLLFIIAGLMLLAGYLDRLRNDDGRRQRAAEP